MSQLAFMIIKTDHTAWIITYEPESSTRLFFTLRAWLQNTPAPNDSISVESWLDANASSLELICPMDLSNKTVSLDDSCQLEYSELLDDLKIY